jgi:hypothetical protein
MGKAIRFCKLCGSPFSVEKRPGKPRSLCDTCAEETGAAFWRGYIRNKEPVQAGSTFTCQFCKQATMVYTGKGPYPSKCDGCKRKHNTALVRRRRGAQGNK